MAQTEIVSPPAHVDGILLPREATTQSAAPIRHAMVAGLSLLAVLLLYVLSYAPFLRLRYGADAPRYFPSGNYLVNQDPPTRPETGPFYKPVEWLIDETRCKATLIKWAEIWKVSEQTQGWHIIFDDDE